MLSQQIEKTGQQPMVCIPHLWYTRGIGFRWWTRSPIQHNTRLPVHVGRKPSLSSVAFPHSNCRAEIGANTLRRILMNTILFWAGFLLEKNLIAQNCSFYCFFKNFRGQTPFGGAKVVLGTPAPL